jgi:DNA-directed RNA polymerase subunit RPC12/RpoP
MRWAGVLPSWIFSSARMSLNLATRLADRRFGTRSSLYGWALAFTPEDNPSVQEPGSPNVCMFCGAGFDEPPRQRVARIFYRCPYCAGTNLLFRNQAADKRR